MLLITFLIGILAVSAAIVAHRRIRSRIGGRGLSDAQIRQIEAVGRLDVEEPLDWKEIQAAEERFWNETWDEAEEW